MPLIRYQARTTARDRYQVWFADPVVDESDWSRSTTIQLMEFRRQEKALGSGTANILQNDTNTNQERILEGNRKLKIGSWIKIVDTWLIDGLKEHEDANPVDFYEEVVFFGYITSVTTDILESDGGNYTGTISFNEIGWKLNEENCTNYFDQYSQALDTPPDFNQQINGIFHGNRINGDKFIADRDSFVKSVDGAWPDGYSADNIWHIQSILELLIKSSTLGLSLAIDPYVDADEVAEKQEEYNNAKNFEVSEYNTWQEILADPGSTEQEINQAQENYEIARDDAAAAQGVLDTAKEGTDVSYFQSVTPPKSYPSYKDMPIMKALDDLVPDPMMWSLNYRTSSGGIEVKIYNSLNVTLADYSTPVTIQLDFSQNDIRMSSFNISEIETPAQKVTVRGSNILCCGCQVPWTEQDQDNCEKDWTDSLENLYVGGSGIYGAPETNDANIADKERTNPKYADVYRKFKMKYRKDVNNKNVLTVPSSPGYIEYTEGGSKVAEQTHYPLCPHFKFVDDEGNILTTPVVQKEFEDTSIQHHTPNPMSMKWSKKLPIYRVKTYAISGGNATINDDQLLDPLALAPTFDESGTNTSSRLYWIDTIKNGQFGNTIKAKMSVRSDEIRLTVTPAPQAFAWDNERIWGGGRRMNNRFWTRDYTPGASNFNPNYSEKLPQTGGKSHWGRFMFVNALYSDQKLEISKAGTYWTLDGGESPIEVEITNPSKHIIINDPSLQLWFCHKNTPKDLDFSTLTGEGDLERFDDDTFTRNDLPIAKKILESAFNWLSVQKLAINVEMPMMNFKEDKPSGLDSATFSGLDIGKVVEKVTDNTSHHQEFAPYFWSPNTSVSSISYNFASDFPTITVSTRIPKMPVLKKMMTEKRSSNVLGGAGQVGIGQSGNPQGPAEVQATSTTAGISYSTGRDYMLRTNVNNTDLISISTDTLDIGGEELWRQNVDGPILLTLESPTSGSNIFSNVDVGQVWDVNQNKKAVLGEVATSDPIGLVVSTPTSGSIRVLTDGFYDVSTFPISANFIDQTVSIGVSGQALSYGQIDNYLSPYNEGVRVQEISGSYTVALSGSLQPGFIGDDSIRMRLFKANPLTYTIHWQPQKQKLVSVCTVDDSGNSSTLDYWFDIDKEVTT